MEKLGPEVASVLPKESLKIIAESAGVTNLSDELAQVMVADVEYRLREVAAEAIKFMKHSKRSRMTTEDVNNALRLRNIEV
jgi:transcription initiation factor TFIID subunit 6